MASLPERGDITENALTSFDIAVLKTYIESLLPLLLSATSKEILLLFAQHEFLDKATRFGQESACQAIYINKAREPLDVDVEDEEQAPSFRYQVSTEMDYNPSYVSTLAIIKRVPALDTLRPLDTQLHVLNLFGPASAESALASVGRAGATQSTTSSASPYETLHSLVHLAVAPYFEAYVNSKAGRKQLESGNSAKSKDADAKMGIPMTKRKFAELELSLLHLQQNVEIPDIHLVIHPVVQRAVERCHSENTRVTPEVIDQATLVDSSFLNKIQSEVNSWIKEIQNVTKLNRDVASGTASQEINFWLSMEKALEGIEDQLRSEPVVLTLDILKNAKRFHATVSFIADTGLKEAADVVYKYNQLMKDFPLNELLAATDLDKIQESLVLIFGHVNKKLKLSPYPIRRALPLVEAISRDLHDQLLRVLGSHRLMYMPYDAFERAMRSASAVFQVWDESIKEFTNVAREVTRKRNEKFLPIKINPAHAELQARVVYLRQFRKQHKQLAQMVAPGKGLAPISNGIESAMDGQVERSAGLANGLADFDMAEEVRAAYESVKTVDVLDTSADGTSIWVAAETTYNERVSRVENQIISRLREHLGAARNATAMFRVFGRFNALFVRPKIRGAIQEWQTQLIDSVKEDIRRLQDKFMSSYRHSEAYHSSQLRDLPPISGAIIWAKQIEKQLYAYMRRVEDVLGKGWELYAEGQKLQSESASFRRKLDTRPIYEAWLHEITRRDLHISGRLFEVTRNRSKAGQLQLGVNFDSQIITLFKEVRNLLWLGFQVPHTINNTAKDAKRVYPHAVSLMESVRTYSQTVDKVATCPEIATLVAEYQSNAQEMITKGMNYRWDHFVNTFITTTSLEGREGRHGQFVREFASVVSVFQDRTDALIEMSSELNQVVDDLATCSYTSEAFSALLSKIQSTIDRLSLEGYANLDAWVVDLDLRVEEVLLARLHEVVEHWCKQLSGGRPSSPSDPAVASEMLRIRFLNHEIRIRNQVIYLDPPIEHARATWYSQLQDWLGVVCGLKRICSSRYETGLKIQSGSSADQNYTLLLSNLDEVQLRRPFLKIEAKIEEMLKYSSKWLQFQSLWDLEAEAVYARLGDSLGSWQQMLQEIRKTRSTFDNAESEHSFGVAVIRYEQVQSKVNAKYDTWQRDILGRFGIKLGYAMKETHATIMKGRKDLEQQSIEGSSTAQAVTFITFVQDLEKRVKVWAPQIDLFITGQKQLERQRYQFPADWLYSDQIDGEWSSFRDILQRKKASIQEQLSGLQMKIVAEDQIVANKIGETVADWESNKPVQGSLKADAAMNSVNVFENRVQKLREDYDLVYRAKGALNLELVRDDRLEPVQEEIKDLKAVWTALSGVWSQINELRETSWASIVPRKIRQHIDGLLSTTRDMPSRMRQYAAFEFVQDALRQFLKANTIVSELKSEALRERHWRQLLKKLRVSTPYSPTQMTLGSVWDLDLKRNEAVIKGTVMQAQGEMALEEFLKQVKETWTNYTLDLINYQNKTRLIRGWDDLFAKCSENLNSLIAMKMSPYYKVFEEEAAAWEDRLNRIHVLFDVWIDVQRQWVYLEGIFTGSADIKHLLPMETSRFGNIQTEFLSVMKKVLKSPFVLDVLNIQGIQKSLERLADLLSKIQKALGEYLERERSAFPRFYFVGDEDLLEIIGNSKDIHRVIKHLKKMFAGIASIKLSPEESQIEAMVSKEGEEVAFFTPIPCSSETNIKDWLSRLEHEMKQSLAKHLQANYASLEQFYSTEFALQPLLSWIESCPAQLVVLAVQIQWTSGVEAALASGEGLQDCLNSVLRSLDILADAVLVDLQVNERRKVEHLITELVHQRDVIRSLIASNIASVEAFEWLYQMRFYLSTRAVDATESTIVKISDASFTYGFEYLGVPDRLVQTPLTDRCYLTLTQALNDRLGGSPFGPAGTGKTESVKALGVQLGRFVLVFCCDESFDFQAMGRIFVGLCQVGAWGCFDEFNRLEERMLSAVSQQVQTIQLGLASLVSNPTTEIELVGKRFKLSTETGIFITMNPGYAGRSNLPDNLKKLFRSMAMTRPDRELIAQVMLFSQGFRTAESLAAKIVPFFNLCNEQLSVQPHYDFGLRALKSVLISAGHLKRGRLQALEGSTSSVSDSHSEQEILIQSVTETIVPKLVADDVPLLSSLLADVFPDIDYVSVDLEQLKAHILTVCAERNLIPDELWLQKTLQLYQIQNIQHGLMMVGPSATGKTQSWRVLLAALERLTGIEGVSYVIDPKAIPKEALYGTLDQTTREWTDGLFTHTLRKIVDNVRGEASKRHWIIFDGDVDPEWVENLNSVLDDNKLLTLPNGERLNLPPNVRVMFEVESLQYATLATVSRCGMVWFSEDTVSPRMIAQNYLQTLRKVPLNGQEDDSPIDNALFNSGQGDPAILSLQNAIVDLLEPHCLDGILPQALGFAASLPHIMDFTAMRAIATLFSLLNKAIRSLIDYNGNHPDFPLSAGQVTAYMEKRLLLALVWALTGDSPLIQRSEMGNFLRDHSGLEMPPFSGEATSLIDFDVNINTQSWVPWANSVPTIEIETHSVLSADVVIPTIDTVRHEEVLYSWLAEHKPLLLCGPPGSGKTMTLFSALRKLTDLEVVGLNFSSATTPELILKTFEQYCEYRKTPTGVVLSPLQIGRWIVVFCDEINLPAVDKYGTQRVISFLRQLVEAGGFWRVSDRAWVKLERVQFVGACNPPTDPGRVPLSHRFLRHAPLVMVDYPGEISLKQIYGTFNRALLKVVPTLRSYAEPLTNAMVEFYSASQERFTSDIQAHYIYSPRELTRWARGIYEALKPLDSLAVEGLVRIWAHEGLRLFQDRLVAEDEKNWTDVTLDQCALRNFPGIAKEEALSRPILFSNWTSKNYISVDREQLREFTKARLRVFYEEELDVPLVLFNDVLDHVLRIDRVFRQTQGHMLLIGISGSGKTTLSRFVAWMNGLSIFQISVHNKYTGEDFDEDLRNVLRRAGCKGEKICFIMDESNVLDSGFLERMNTLLANAEVPGLFEGDEHATLMTACKEGAQRDGLMLDAPEELYKWFTQQVAKNLHVVFTMNPAAEGLASRAATSPALFNRCVLDWFGDWSEQAFYQVGSEFSQSLDLEVAHYEPPATFPVAYRDLALPPNHRVAVNNAFVFVHQSVIETNHRLGRRQGRYSHVTPRHFLDFIGQYVRLFTEKREALEEQQRHLNVGLDKLQSTVSQVEELRISLAQKRKQLEAKNVEANEKLQKMVADQQEAEQQRATSIKIQAELEVQNQEIEERRSIVLTDLAAAEPAVLDAQAAVSSIKKQHLTEVRSMANPPEAVKLAMESVCTILGHRIDSWKTVQGIIRRDDFISSIVNFDTNKQMTRQLRDRMKNDYLSRPSYNFAAVNRASQACGPLVSWVLAQVGFSEILDRVGPLRNEVQSLEDQAATTQAQASTIVNMISELEASIDRYKDEYAGLISETQSIKSEMERVETRVNRSVKLLTSLESEQSRWEDSSKSFEAQMSTVAGDVLLSAAFLAYSGYFDQHYRQQMWSAWCLHLQQADIAFKADLSFAEYLSTVDERLIWQSHSLPADDLCTENAIMMKRHSRYPLIIDPSGQAATFLANEYKQRKLLVTSFLDESFLKNLESALRFGTPLLIQDVEHLDPILNPVLNKEIRKAGGRVLIRLGSQDIDISPSFELFLSTRDPSIDFAPDICSRVTFVNFTMTRSSLQSQSLDQVLKAERPDTDQKRSDLVKLQGEFRLRLRHLEKALLQALNESSGNILDDDKVIDTLETLKSEAAEITQKAMETDRVIQEVEQVTAQYLPLAQFCSSLYFALDQLNVVNHFYRFSLAFFLDIFNFVLRQNPNLKNVNDPQERLAILIQDLFVNVFKRTSMSLLHQDHLTLALTLTKIRLHSPSTQQAAEELDGLLHSTGQQKTMTQTPSSDNVGFTASQIANLFMLQRAKAFERLWDQVQEQPAVWQEFILAGNAEDVIPDLWSDLPDSQLAVRRLALVQALRPDRTLPAATKLVNTVLQIDIAACAGYDLSQVVTQEVRGTTPVVLASVPGFDASYRIERLSAASGTPCVSVALGSQEGYALAEQAIADAARKGSWVLVKNCHLAPSWLSSLEKRLQSLRPQSAFRLFLTMEASPKIPASILRQSRIIMNEPTPGLKANLLGLLRGIPESRHSLPAETARVQFLLCWLQAVITQRLRFAPLSFTQIYEFNDSDFSAGLKRISAWVEHVAKGRSNVDPASIPWLAIRTSLSQYAFGGRVDVEQDQAVLESFIDHLFQPKAYDVDFPLVTSEQSLHIPDCTNIAGFIDWTSTLPEQDSPSLLGLQPKAATVIATQQANALFTSLEMLRTLSEEEDETVGSGPEASRATDMQPAWMKQLGEDCESYLKALPEAISALLPQADNAHEPLVRFFRREHVVFSSVLRLVRTDLQSVVDMCKGSRQTNYLRLLVQCITKGLIPPEWSKYKTRSGTNLAQWIEDLSKRVQQLEAGMRDGFRSVWVGGLALPSGWITATRQAAAHKLHTSIEKLHLSILVGHGAASVGEAASFTMQGMSLHCAEWSDGALRSEGNEDQELESTQLRWSIDKDSLSAAGPTYACPVYLYSDRKDLLFSTRLPTSSPTDTLLQKGACLVAGQ